MNPAPSGRVGVLSDTHGVLSNRVVEFFTDACVTAVIHAGDGVTTDIRGTLTRIAPFVEVRGNMDSAGRPSVVAEFGGLLVYVIHQLDDLDIDPVAAGVMAVISGHTHVPSIHWREGILYLNPGSASFPRQGSAASVALLELDDTGRLTPTIHNVYPLQ